MVHYAYYAFASAVFLASLSLILKALVRYRICDSGLVTWGMGVSAGLVAAVVWLVLRPPFPSQAVWPLLAVVAAVQFGLWALNRALQEGDLSIVVPLLSLRIPLAAAMAVVFLGETHGLGIYSAVLLSCVAVALFGMGRPLKAQGGHGAHPAVPIGFACAGAAAFALSDPFAKLVIDSSGAADLLIWSLMLRGGFCAVMLVRPTYRQYRVAVRDWGMFLLSGGVTVAGLGCLYKAFLLADGVTLVNVILGTRGLFGLLMGAVLGRVLRVPLEKQPVRIYVLRVVASGLLFAALLIVLLG